MSNGVGLEDLSLLLKKAAREHLKLKEGDEWPYGIAQAQATALSPFLDEMDRNARAYGWEIGHGREMTASMEFSDENPFTNKNWRTKVN